MDMRNYGTARIKAEHVRDGSITARVVRVFQDAKYNRPVLELEDGSEFLLNATNVTALIKTLGPESDLWLGAEVTLELGTYKDWSTDPPTEKETVKIRAAAATQNGASGAVPLPAPKPPPAGSLRRAFDDDIPFGPERR